MFMFHVLTQGFLREFLHYIAQQMNQFYQYSPQSYLVHDDYGVKVNMTSR
jgi:hypothetical protein